MTLGFLSLFLNKLKIYYLENINRIKKYFLKDYVIEFFLAKVDEIKKRNIEKEKQLNH